MLGENPDERDDAGSNPTTGSWSLFTLAVVRPAALSKARSSHTMSM